MFWFMGRKSKSEEPKAPESAFAKRPWWIKATTAAFKAQLAQMSYEELHVLAELVRGDLRKCTLRPHVEELSLEDQKLAPRLAALHRGRLEAVLARIHSIPRPTTTPKL